VDEPARVAGVRAAAGVHEQPEQALGLRPALDGVLLVHVARHVGQVPDPLVGLVAAADPLLGERLQQHLDALAPLLARPRATTSTEAWKASASRAAAISCSARRRREAAVLRSSAEAGTAA
jgi:hypothetical protein